MKIWIFLATFLMVSVSGYIDEWNLIQTEKHFIEIYCCLESNSDLWNNLSNYIDVIRWKDHLLHSFLRDFQWRTLHMEYVNRTLTNVLHDLVRWNQLSRNQAGNVRVAIFDALLNCSQYERINASNEFFNQPGNHELPMFRYEPPHIRDLLDFVLVDTESLLEQPNGMTELFSFARDVLQVLETSLGPFTSFEVMATLRRIWWVGAENFYDFTHEIPYIRHAYDMNSSTVYTRDDPGLFNSRMRDEFNIRNAPASQEDISRVLSFHPRERRNHNNDLFYSLPRRLRLTEAEVYYEIQENRFFRVLFFYLELVERYIIDFSGNVLTNRPIPADLIELLLNETHYGPYLKMAMNRELSRVRFRGSSRTELFVSSLREHNRILEPDVIMLFILRLRSSITTTVVPMTSTVASIGASSTSRSEDSSKEKDVTRNPHRNDSPNNQAALDDKDNGNCQYNSGPTCSKKFKNLQPFDEYFTYGVGPSDSKPSILIMEDGIALKFLQDTLSTMFRIGMYMEKGLICH